MMLRRLSTLILLIGFGGSAYAADIILTPADCGLPDGTGEGAYMCWTATQTRQPDAQDLADWIGGDASDYEEQYKANVGDEDNPATTEGGPFAASYETTFNNTPLDPTDAWIQYQDGQPSITCTELDPCYVMVKDGKQSPSIYIFRITNWGPGDDLSFEGFWPDQGAISNVSIWNGGKTDMPEPGTLALLGLGLVGMGVMRRRRTS